MIGPDRLAKDCRLPGRMQISERTSPYWLLVVMTYKGVATSSLVKVMHGDIGTQISKGQRCY